ncbi:hypothetical protein, partial [Vibrio breoganii]|uniref:hypothetical protein n=1 Tax=Vibrio breoganii TaxID=553239 RepID=UPI001A7E09DF
KVIRALIHYRQCLLLAFTGSRTGKIRNTHTWCVMLWLSRSLVSTQFLMFCPNPSFDHVLYRTVNERTLAIQFLVCQFSRFD